METLPSKKQKLSESPKSVTQLVETSTDLLVGLQLLVNRKLKSKKRDFELNFQFGGGSSDLFCTQAFNAMRYFSYRTKAFHPPAVEDIDAAVAFDSFTSLYRFRANQDRIVFKCAKQIAHCLWYLQILLQRHGGCSIRVTIDNAEYFQL